MRHISLCDQHVHVQEVSKWRLCDKFDFSQEHAALSGGLFVVLCVSLHRGAISGGWVFRALSSGYTLRSTGLK